MQNIALTTFSSWLRKFKKKYENIYALNAVIQLQVALNA